MGKSLDDVKERMQNELQWMDKDRGKSLKLRPGMSATQPRGLGGAMKSNLCSARAGVIYIDMSIISEAPPYAANGGD